MNWISSFSVRAALVYGRRPVSCGRIKLRSKSMSTTVSPSNSPALKTCDRSKSENRSIRFAGKLQDASNVCLPFEVHGFHRICDHPQLSSEESESFGIRIVALLCVGLEQRSRHVLSRLMMFSAKAWSE